jgi:hypothetical protein
MAHIFPLDFELIFNKSPVEWSMATARPFSWRRSDGWRYLGMVVVSPSKHEGFQFYLREWEIPDILKKQLFGNSQRLSAISRQIEIEVVVGQLMRSDFVPVLADPWTLRNDFLDLKSNNESLVGFLNKCGEWKENVEFSSGYFVEPRIKAFLPGPFWLDRSKLIDLINEGPESWEPTYVPPFALNKRREFPHLYLEERRCFDAMIQTVTIDHLRGVKFKVCLRSDCRKPFALESAHVRD